MSERMEPLFSSSEVGRQLGIRLCENLGLDPVQVVALDFHWRPHSLPTVTAELLINEVTVHELLTLVPAESSNVK